MFIMFLIDSVNSTRSRNGTGRVEARLAEADSFAII